MAVKIKIFHIRKKKFNKTTYMLTFDERICCFFLNENMHIKHEKSAHFQLFKYFRSTLKENK